MALIGEKTIRIPFFKAEAKGHLTDFHEWARRHLLPGMENIKDKAERSPHVWDRILC
jgi:hypothetical protein